VKDRRTDDNRANSSTGTEWFILMFQKSAEIIKVCARSFWSWSDRWVV